VATKKKTTRNTGSAKKRATGQTSKSAAAGTKTRGKSNGKQSADTPVPVDRRSSSDRRKKSDRREKSEPVAVERRAMPRRAKVSRRRQIDPTTCERDYTPDEVEFMSALDEYKRVSGRMFPTCSEVLEVIKKLGYEKCPQIQPGEATATQMAEVSSEAELGYLPQGTSA